MTGWRELERNVDEQMNEHEAWPILKHKLNNFGVATRLENAASTSVPDVLYIFNGLIVFIEMKIDYRGKIYVPPYQHSYAVKIGNFLKDHMHWVAVYNEDVKGFMMFTYRRVRSMPMESRNNKLIFEWKPVWDVMKTKFVLADIESCKEWINAIQGLEFK